jgi:HAD superfamily hydrolase (TIGR01484 family)
MSEKPRALSEWSVIQKQGIRTVLCDIDDTLTRDNRLEASAYAALWNLHDAGYRVVPVTGRPAGWCDAIIRQWPVDAVIGENGAFTYYLEGGVRRELYHPESGDPHHTRDALKRIAERVFKEVPGTRGAKDQAFRTFDFAVDFREEPPFLDFDDAETIRRICESEGAVAKVSSIHVNFWLGAYDKRSMVRYTMEQLWGLSMDDPAVLETMMFCGDSPNDEPMFSLLPNSFGVANVRDFLEYMSSPPAFITSAAHGQGFAELVAQLLDVPS